MFRAGNRAYNICEYPPGVVAAHNYSRRFLFGAIVKKASKYVLLNTGLLDDYQAVNLPDNTWRKMIEAIFRNPKNIRCEPTEARYLWQISRKKLSPLIFARDPHICRMCGSTERLEIDHIIPLSRGGSNELTNLQILCRHCNSVKRDK